MISKSFFYTLFFSTTAMFAATPAIGIVTASGHVSIEHSQVWGNATLFDGATIETNAASSDVALRNGVRLQLGASSKARVFENRALLEKGVGQVGGSPSYELDAASLRIHADSGRARVTLGDRIEVAALTGSARVMNANGVLLASLAAGRSMSFEPQNSPAVSHTGCLLYKDGHFILQDENDNSITELNGPDLAKNTGNRVTATGTLATARPAVQIATSVMNVTKVDLKSPGGCLTAASTLNAQTEAPAGAGKGAAVGAAAGAAGGAAAGAAAGAAGGAAAGAAAGISTGAIVGIVAGGGAAAAVGVIVATKGKSSTSQ
ncbi:MAG TPA: hypothetical protein VKS01_03880 [Bryobacteraceae bacterium]|nr:hypothetical protein [Bryobacteraceae bacterium]